MPSTISKALSLDKAKDFTKLLRGEKPHHPHEKCSDETLEALDKIHESFEPPALKYKIEGKSNPNQAAREPQPPRVLFKTSSELHTTMR